MDSQGAGAPPGPSAGRHRKPIRPGTVRAARVALVCGAVVVLIGVLVAVVRLTSDNTAKVTAVRPDSPVASLSPVVGGSGTSAGSVPSPGTSGTSGTSGGSGTSGASGTGGQVTVAPSTSATSPAAGPSPSETPAAPQVGTPAGAPAPVAARAAAAIADLARLQAAANPGAPVAAAPLGAGVRTAPGREQGAWGARRLANGLTLGANNERALRAGKVTASVDLPTATTVARVRLPSGERYTAPVASAATVFTQLQAGGGPACPTCEPVVVTGVKPATMVQDTDAGTVTLPAWSYTVRGSKVTLVRPAVTDAGLIRFGPAYRGGTPAAVDAQQLPLWRTALRQGRILTARLDPKDVKARATGGGCWRLFASQSDAAVAVYAAKGPADATGACADRAGNVSVRLAAPLGDRPVIDTYWQRVLALR